MPFNIMHSVTQGLTCTHL